MSRPLRFHVMLMTMLRDEDDPRYRGFIRGVELAETLGFDGVWTGNSYAIGGPDPFAMLGQVAAVSETLSVGTSVFLLPMRHPTTVALQVATLDHLTGGRVQLGVGVGGERGADFTLNGISPRERGARMDEALEVIPQLWSGQEVDHHGPFYHISGRLGIESLQQPLPILIGARGGASPQQQRAYRRVVSAAQGWLPYIMTPSGYARGRAAIRDLGGDDDLIFGLVEAVNIGSGDGMDAVEEAAMRETRAYGGTPERFRSLVLAGNVQMVVDRMNEFADLGVTEFVFNWACDPRAVPEQMRVLAAEVLPAVRAHVAERAVG